MPIVYIKQLKQYTQKGGIRGSGERNCMVKYVNDQEYSLKELTFWLWLCMHIFNNLLTNFVTKSQ